MDIPMLWMLQSHYPSYLGLLHTWQSPIAKSSAKGWRKRTRTSTKKTSALRICRTRPRSLQTDFHISKSRLKNDKVDLYSPYINVIQCPSPVSFSNVLLHIRQRENTCHAVTQRLGEAASQSPWQALCSVSHGTSFWNWKLEPLELDVSYHSSVLSTMSYCACSSTNPPKDNMSPKVVKDGKENSERPSSSAWTICLLHVILYLRAACPEL